jgi:hypothetical protein
VCTVLSIIVVENVEFEILNSIFGHEERLRFIDYFDNFNKIYFKILFEKIYLLYTYKLMKINSKFSIQ